jgi:hypothetical protein
MKELFLVLTIKLVEVFFLKTILKFLLFKLYFCLVWSLKSKINYRVFKHKYPLSAVAVTNEDICISGGYRGSIKVFQISTGKLIKVII